MTWFEVGDRVSYEDMANPRRVGTVVGKVYSERWGTLHYHVEWDDGGGTVSDMRQRGWRKEA